MKTRLYIVALLSFLATEASAQNFLKKLGKEIGNAVKKEVVKKVNKKNNNSHVSNENVHHISPQELERQEIARQEREAREAEEAAKLARLKSLPFDNGENIPRDNSLDYVDEYGINHGGGILIDSIVWAPVNCGYHATDYPYGKLYQWGRKHGQGYGEPYTEMADKSIADKTTAELVPGPVTVDEARKDKNSNVFYMHVRGMGFNWTKNDMWLWNEQSLIGDKPVKIEKNDPCPKGWRVPDWHEFEKLQKNQSFWTTDNMGQNGVWLCGSQEYNHNIPRIFLPATGKRDWVGKCGGRTQLGAYWTSRHHGGELLVGQFLVYDDNAYCDVSGNPYDGQAIRCVKE